MPSCYDGLQTPTMVHITSPPDRFHLSLKRPFLNILYQTGPHRIGPHIFPFLRITLGRTQHMVKKSFLPHMHIILSRMNDLCNSSLQCLDRKTNTSFSADSNKAMN